MNAERQRLGSDAHALARWRKWGPYLSDRAWGTVREDYSANGDAWSFLPHDLARFKAYRWGEDGIAGVSDRYQVLCWSMAFWNERDPILKERYFGVVPAEGNHGEDVKECYFYLDALPSHAYQRMLYKYPQRAFPYAQLVDENRRRGPADAEFELIDTGIFDDQRYFDIFIEAAKESEEAIVFRISAHNRGPERAPLHLIPQLWFRNTWSWNAATHPHPVLRASNGAILADDSAAPPLPGLLADTHLGPYRLELPPEAQLLFTDNETNAQRVYGNAAESRSKFTKDAFHRRIVSGERDAVNPSQTGTKACGWLRVEIEPGECHVMDMRLARAERQPTTDNRQLFLQRRKEADEFYSAIHPAKASADERRIQ